jgi:hypothetical protein
MGHEGGAGMGQVASLGVQHRLPAEGSDLPACIPALAS